MREYNHRRLINGIVRCDLEGLSKDYENLALDELKYVHTARTLLILS